MTLLACFTVAGANENNPRSGSAAVAAKESDRSPGAAINGTSPAKQTVRVNAYQKVSVMRIRIIPGGLPVKEYTGALIHFDELKEASSFYDQNRCVVALVKGLSDVQLRADGVRILITRNLPNSVGDLEAKTFPGRFAGRDDKTGLASFTFRQGFSAVTEAGFHLRREIPKLGLSAAMCFVNQPAAQPSPVAEKSQSQFGQARGQPRPVPALRVAVGSFVLDRESRGTLEFPDEDAQVIRDEAPLITSAPAFLDGFLNDDGNGTATFVPVTSIAHAFRFPTLRPTSIAFVENGQGVGVEIELERLGPEPVPYPVNLRFQKWHPDEEVDLDVVKLSSDLMIAQEHPINPNPKRPGWFGSYQGFLGCPKEVGEEIGYLIQVGWRIATDSAEPSFFARPFLIKMKREQDRIVFTTKGIKNANDADAMSAECK